MGKCQIAIVEKIPGRDLNLLLPTIHTTLLTFESGTVELITFPYLDTSLTWLLYREILYTPPLQFALIYLIHARFLAIAKLNLIANA